MNKEHLENKNKQKNYCLDTMTVVKNEELLTLSRKQNKFKLFRVQRLSAQNVKRLQQARSMKMLQMITFNEDKIIKINQ